VAEQSKAKTPIACPPAMALDSSRPELLDVGADDGALLARVSGILDGFRDLHERAIEAYRPMVNDILRLRSRDAGQIERTLDGLLGFCGHDAALALFKQLCRYYWDIDPEATAWYVHAYRDWFEADDRCTGAALES